MSIYGPIFSHALGPEGSVGEPPDALSNDWEVLVRYGGIGGAWQNSYSADTYRTVFRTAVFTPGVTGRWIRLWYGKHPNRADTQPFDSVTAQVGNIDGEDGYAEHFVAKDIGFRQTVQSWTTISPTYPDRDTDYPILDGWDDMAWAFVSNPLLVPIDGTRSLICSTYALASVELHSQVDATGEDIPCWRTNFDLTGFQAIANGAMTSTTQRGIRGIEVHP